MRLTKRRFLAYVGASLPAIGAASCAGARAPWPEEWPGPDTPHDQLPKLPIGMNLAGIADWEPGFPFRNLMWGARPWLTRDAEPGGPWNTNVAELFEYDSDGYPLEVPIMAAGHSKPQQVFTLLPNVLKPGKYTLYYDGVGRFEAFLGTTISSSEAGRINLEMKHQQGLGEGIAITQSKRGDHIRNVRIVSNRDDVSTLHSQPFLPEFLAFCRPFHALRFMDWGSINNSIEEGWETRRKLSFYTMVGGSGDADGLWAPKPTGFQRRFSGGVAIELMLQLANQLEIDPWICIPHRATDDYIRELATLTERLLNRDRQIYLEFSNELWNWQFKQAHTMLRSEIATDALERAGIPAWKITEKGREGISHPERIGALFSHAFSAWDAAWPKSERARVIKVCSVQGAWFDASRRTIEWCAERGSVDAVSAGGYFDASAQAYKEWDSTRDGVDPHSVIEQLRVSLLEQTKGGSLLQIAQEAKRRGLKYLTYEGGQHLQPKGQKDVTYLDALGKAQKLPGMYDLYVENLRFQKHLGCQLFCAFSSISKQGTKYGSWGVKGSYDDPDSSSPKLKALIDCNTNR